MLSSILWEVRGLRVSLSLSEALSQTILVLLEPGASYPSLEVAGRWGWGEIEVGGDFSVSNWSTRSLSELGVNQPGRHRALQAQDEVPEFSLHWPAFGLLKSPRLGISQALGPSFTSTPPLKPKLCGAEGMHALVRWLRFAHSQDQGWKLIVSCHLTRVVLSVQCSWAFL